MTTPSTSWDETSPGGSDALNQGDNSIRLAKTSIREVIDVDHKFASSGTDADNGCHDQVTLLEKSDLGTGAVGKTILGSQTVSGVGELVYTTETDADIQITKGDKINTAACDLTLSSLSGLLAIIYPIGCIYTSIVSTNPNTVFGFGTWVAFGGGRVLAGIHTSGTFNVAAESTGGVETVTLTSAQSGVPAHTHQVKGSSPNSGGTSTLQGAPNNTLDTTITSEANTAADAAQAHTNLQPYICVYFFKRTA